jgi:hypothetical protein
LLIVFHAGETCCNVQLPAAPAAMRWYRVADTSLAAPLDFAEQGAEVPIEPADASLVNPRSSVVLVAR